MVISFILLIFTGYLTNDDMYTLNDTIQTDLFDGTIYQGLSVDEAIELAKNAPNPELLPTIEVWVKYPN